MLRRWSLRSTRVMKAATRTTVSRIHHKVARRGQPITRLAGRWVSRRAAALLEDPAEQAHHRIVVGVGDALLERDDGVVGDLDVLRADLGAALGDVAEADAALLLEEGLAVGG